MMCDVMFLALGGVTVFAVILYDRALHCRSIYEDVRHRWERDWLLQQRIIDNLKKKKNGD